MEKWLTKDLNMKFKEHECQWESWYIYVKRDLRSWKKKNKNYCMNPSLVREQTLKKDLKRNQGTSVEVKRVDLANWAIRTSPKFTTGVKYQFHQGLWPDQRSGNTSHPSPPYIMSCTNLNRPPVWCSGQHVWLPSKRSRVRFPAIP